jgi:LemA protein
VRFYGGSLKVKKILSSVASVSIILVSVMVLSGCGVQSIPTSKNAVDAAVAEMTNQYKRRSDLVPNLVNVVKGYAKQEKDVLTAVTEARAKATSMTIDPSKATPAQLSAYANNQGQLSQALGKLLSITENYPDLKSNENFRDLSAQIEGTENRITIARQRYIQEIQGFNNLVSVFPTSLTNSLMFHYEKMPQWGTDQPTTLQDAPKVDFGSGGAGDGK